MKKMLILLLSMMSGLSGLHAQKPTTEREIDSLAQTKIREAQERFSQDSVKFITTQNEKLQKKIEKIRKEADKRKAAQTQRLQKEKKEQTKVQEPSDSTSQERPPVANDSVPVLQQPDSIPSPTFPNNVEDRKNTCNALLTQLHGSTHIPHTRQCILDILGATDDIEQYAAIADELQEIDRQLTTADINSCPELSDFIKDLQRIQFAQTVLMNPFNKRDRDEAREELKHIAFYTEGQKKSAHIALIQDGIIYYYLATSNMLDLINEIKDIREKYHSQQSEQTRSTLMKELKESVDFVARVNNFRKVKYMSDMYDDIINNILVRGENGEFKIESFDMEKLNKWENELKAARKSK